MKIHLESFGRNDTLDEQVAALPPSYTSRFGEIVWAAGGNGFGWWPSVIYDPRLVVGSARKLALKHVGKKHLVYFFGCSEAPFTVLSDARCLNWDIGLMEDYENGKTARTMGKARSLMFEWALQAAIAENDKPIEYRLDWNHDEDPFIGVKQNSTNAAAAAVSANASGKPAISGSGPAVANSRHNRPSGGGGNKRPRPSPTSSSPSSVKNTPSEMDGDGNGNEKAISETQSQQTTQTTQSKKRPRSSVGTSDAKAARVAISSVDAAMMPVRRSNRERKPSRSLLHSDLLNINKLSSSSPPKKPPSALSETASTDNSVKVVIRGVRPSTPIQSNVSVKETSSSSKIKLHIKSKPRQAQADNESSANINTAMEDSELFCTILRNDKVTTLHHISTTDRDIITEIISSPETLNIGFITFPNSSCTFANARKVMKKELDVEGERDDNDSDCDSDSEEEDETDCLPKKFKFYVPHLGKISKKQETKFGPMLAFLQKSKLNDTGNGSQRNPLKIIVYDSSNSSK